MQQLHRVTQQDFRVQIAAAVDGQQVVQIECERRIRQPLTAGGIARRQPLVAPAWIRSYEIKEEVDLRSLGAVGRHDAVRRGDAHGHAASEHTADVVIHEAVIEQVAQHRGHTADGQCGTHGRLRDVR